MNKAFLLSFMLLTTLSGKKPEFITHKSPWAEKTLKSLSLREKIGQLFVIATASKTAQEQPEVLASSMVTCPYNLNKEHALAMIKNYYIGGIIFLYKSDPETQVAFTQEFQKQSKIPLLIAQDCEWGLSMRLDLDPSKVVRYPRNMTLGALTATTLIYQVGKEIGKQCATLGIHLNLAPVADINNNEQNLVIHDRSFGDNPDTVAQLSMHFAQGLHDAGILACAKHFPGHGDTAVDSHVDLPVIFHDKQRINSVELVPFKKLINYGIDAVMNGHLSIPALDNTPNQPSSMSFEIVTHYLKNSLNFDGLVITDGLGMQAITKHYEPGEIELQAFLAGNDIILCPLDVPQAINLIEDAIKKGRVSQAELDQRVLKILKAKEWAIKKQKKYTKKNFSSFIRRPKAYELQDKAYRNAITLAKNDATIPLNSDLLKSSFIAQLGTTPQSSFLNECKKYTNSIIQCAPTLSEHEMKTCLELSKNCNTVIIAIAQMNKAINQRFGISNTTFDLITALKKMGKKIIVVVFGTPYCIPLLTSADLIIEAYEDAEPAQKAVVDVLTGTLYPKGAVPISYKQKNLENINFK